MQKLRREEVKYESSKTQRFKEGIDTMTTKMKRLGSLVGMLIALFLVGTGTAFAADLVVDAVTFHAHYTWALLAVVGIVVLLSASMAERGGGRFFQMIKSHWGRMGR
mgnify:CR=1 FL=1